MQILDRRAIDVRLGETGSKRLTIQPLLEADQIGAVTIDLRLGYDFLVSVLTRKPYITLHESEENFRTSASYFQVTRREFGDRFVLYPNQLVLTTTLEYLSLPSDVFADVITRSSYSRLGLSLNTMVQPGFRGCFHLELANQGNNPVELVVGSRLVQARLFTTEVEAPYQGVTQRKYIGGVRPLPSSAAKDHDLPILEKVRQQH